MGPKKAPDLGVKCFTKAYIGQNVKKIFLSEITGPRALLFGMKHHLVDLYQVCSNDTPGAKNGPPHWSHILHRLQRENVKTSTCVKPQGLEP